MQTASADRTRNSGSTSFVTLVSDKYRKDYQVPFLDYQTGGIRSTTLWPTAMTCMRVIPGYDTATGEILHQNIKCAEYVKNCDPKEYISDTFYTVRTMSGLGESRKTVITSYRPGSPEYQRWGGDTVLSWFASDIIHAVNAARDKKTPKLHPDPKWFGWTTYDKISKKMSILPFDRETLLMQALVWTLNGRNHRNKDKQDLVDASGNPLPLLYVVGIDNSLSQTEMYRALVEPQDPSKPLNGLTNNSYKGIAEQEGSILWLLPGAVQVKDKKNNVLNPHVSSNGSSWVNTPMPISDEQIKAWWHPWDDLLHFLTPDEQIELLAGEFGATTVNYFLANNGQLSGIHVPDSVAKAGLGEYAKYMSGGTVELSSRPASAVVDAVPAPAPSVGFGMPSFQLPTYAPAVSVPQMKAPSSALSMPSVHSMPAVPGAPAGKSTGTFEAPASSADIQSELAKMRKFGIGIASSAVQPGKQDELSSMSAELVDGPIDDDGDANSLLPF